jgi:hypothetical protein
MIVTEQRFTLSRHAAWWTPDGTAVVTRALDLTVWDADSLPPGSRARVEHALRSVPWRVVDGQLREVRAAVAGRVLREGLPVVDAQVTITVRDLPARSTRMTWMVYRARSRAITVTTGLDGRYQAHDLPAGEYTLRATSADLGCRSAVLTRTLQVDEAVDVELTECGEAVAPP